MKSQLVLCQNHKYNNRDTVIFMISYLLKFKASKIKEQNTELKRMKGKTKC